MLDTPFEEPKKQISVSDSPQSQMRKCQYCSDGLTNVYHSGKCPNVKAIEYYQNGAIKRVEFFEKEAINYG